MEIIAIVENRNVKIQDISVIGDNADYVIKFQFDEEWDGVTKTARFERRNGKYADVVLVEDSCEIPVQILKSDYIKIGVYSEKMTTTPTEINVIASVKDRSGIPEKPHYDVYAQLLEKIDKLKGSGMDEEALQEIVSEETRKYIEENGIEVDTSSVNEMVETYIEEHKEELKGADGAPGRDGADGKSPYEIAVEHGYTGTEEEWLESLKGADGAKGETKVEKDYYVHLSFDDVELCLNNLITNDYASLWEEPFFAWLKNLHNTYGAKFSLYLYNISRLSSVPDTYKSEFMQSNDWLKFGLHSKTKDGNYASATYNDAQQDWNNVVTQVIRFAGSHKSIDRIPRLNYFRGSLNALKGMRDADCGALGFLCADDARDSYYLDSNQNSFLRNHDQLIDVSNGLYFYQTDFRGDWFKSGFTSNYDYDVPTERNVYDELVRRLHTAKYADTFMSYIWFCHEWQIYANGTLNSYKSWVEDTCRFAKDYGIAFDFPQNRIIMSPTSLQFFTGGSSEEIETTAISMNRTALTFTTNTAQTLTATVTPSDSTQAITWNSDNTDIATVQNGVVTPKSNGSCKITATSGSFSAECSVTVDISENTGDAEETVTWNTKGDYTTDTIVKTDPNDLVYTAGCAISGYSGGTGGQSTVNKGRATHIGYCLGVNGGETFSLVQNVPDTTLTFAVYESSASPLGGNNTVKNGNVALEWLTDKTTLQSSTKYVCIAFKNGSGTSDFTEEQLELLPGCIQIS